MTALVLLCFAFDVLLFFVCPALSKNVFGETKGRRLSEGSGKDEDDVSPPSTPELLDFCFEIEKELTSEEILPEAPRASPVMVQEVLDALEGSEASPPGIWPEDALQANVESGKAAEKVGIPSSSVTSASFESEEAVPVSDAGLLDVHGSSFKFHSLSLGNQLSPGDAYTETSRASSLMVQEFLNELEREGETEPIIGLIDPLDTPHLQNLKPPTLGLSVKRPAPDDGEDDGEVAGPSSKVAKTDTTPSPQWSVSSPETKESSPFSAAESTESGDFVSSVASGSLESEELLDLINFSIPELEPSDAPPVPPSVSADASPSSTEILGPSSAPSVPDTTVHPWLRVPDFTPGKGDMKFRPECLRWPVQYHDHAPLLVKIRELLVQPKLDHDDAKRLVGYSQFLANHAFHKMKGPVSSRRPTSSAEALGRRFMIFYSLHSASKALRQTWPQQQWWRDLASVIPSTCPFTPGGKGMKKTSQASVALAVQLSAAIELYKSGSAPDDDQVVDIMRKLFCSPESPHHFKTDLWDPWRRDDDPLLFSS
ncbi:hypothetical protein Emed_003742 [Eimeria media]